MKSLLQDRNQQINADSDPDLGFDGVGRCTVKGLVLSQTEWVRWTEGKK